MKRIHIKQKLQDIGVSLGSIIMGDFDTLGEFTAKRTRSPEEANYAKFGAVYRSNYERGILIYNLIRQFNLSSMLEIGFGRGYATLCAAKAFHDSGIDGTVTSIDPNLNEDYVQSLKRILPPELFKYLNLKRGRSQDVLPTLTTQFGLVYIDGDHSYEATRSDWEMTKDRFSHFVLFDDYHLPSKQDKGTIECSRAIDEIDWKASQCSEPELIIMDRRIFQDERMIADDQIDYGQVLLSKDDVNNDVW